jgi:hypothetical protein
MATNQRGSIVREAVGVFDDADTLQEAIDDLLSSGFERAEVSLLASAAAVDEKLGHQYRKVEEVEDDPSAPRTYFVSQDAIDEVKSALVGGLVFLGAVGALGAVVASGGALAAAIAGAAIGAGTWGLFGEILAKFVGDQHAAYIQEQLAHGGLLLWVRCASLEQEKRATEILSKHSGRDVHLHSLPATA